MRLSLKSTSRDLALRLCQVRAFLPNTSVGSPWIIGYAHFAGKPPWTDSEIINSRIGPSAPVYDEFCELACRFFNAIGWFTEAWTVRGDGGSFSSGGDSGSLVVSEDGTQAVGLLFAGTPFYSIMIPMNYVQTLFGGVELVSGHHA